MDELRCPQGHEFSETHEMAPGIMTCACRACGKLYRAIQDEHKQWMIQEVRLPAGEDEQTNFPVVGDARPDGGTL